MTVYYVLLYTAAAIFFLTYGFGLLVEVSTTKE